MNLKLAIVASGKSQRQIAAKAEPRLTENRLSEIVQGWVVPREEEKAALASVLNVSADTLFDTGLRPPGNDDHN